MTTLSREFFAQHSYPYDVGEPSDDLQAEVDGPNEAMGRLRSDGSPVVVRNRRVVHAELYCIDPYIDFVRANRRPQNNGRTARDWITVVRHSLGETTPGVKPANTFVMQPVDSVRADITAIFESKIKQLGADNTLVAHFKDSLVGAMEAYILGPLRIKSDAEAERQEIRSRRVFRGRVDRLLHDGRAAITLRPQHSDECLEAVYRADKFVEQGIHEGDQFELIATEDAEGAVRFRINPHPKRDISAAEWRKVVEETERAIGSYDATNDY
jgi:hypothetical protein